MGTLFLQGFFFVGSITMLVFIGFYSIYSFNQESKKIREKYKITAEDVDEALEKFKNTSGGLTIGQLKKVIEFLDDDMPVGYFHDDSPDCHACDSWKIEKLVYHSIYGYDFPQNKEQKLTKVFVLL